MTSEDKNAVEDEAKANLSKVTAYITEAEINMGDAQQTMSNLEDDEEREARQARYERECKLAKIKVSESDVSLVADQLEMDKKKVRRLLREHGGDPKSAMASFLLPEALPPPGRYRQILRPC
eukprot:155884_1